MYKTIEKNIVKTMLIKIPDWSNFVVSLLWFCALDADIKGDKMYKTPIGKIIKKKYTELTKPEEASSTEPILPTIIVSTTPISIVPSWPMIIGMPSFRVSNIDFFKEVYWLQKYK